MIVESWSDLLGLVGKMYSKIQSCWRGSGRNHRGTEDTKIDHYIQLNWSDKEEESRASYEEAENWLLEDEFEPVEGRLSPVEI